MQNFPITWKVDKILLSFSQVVEEAADKCITPQKEGITMSKIKLSQVGVAAIAATLISLVAPTATAVAATNVAATSTTVSPAKVWIGGYAATSKQNATNAEGVVNVVKVKCVDTGGVASFGGATDSYFVGWSVNCNAQGRPTYTVIAVQNDKVKVLIKDVKPGDLVGFKVSQKGPEVYQTVHIGNQWATTHSVGKLNSKGAIFGVFKGAGWLPEFKSNPNLKPLTFRNTRLNGSTAKSDRYGDDFCITGNTTNNGANFPVSSA